MKRLVWLLLALFCTAFAQVQAVELLLPTNAHCACGGGCNGSCGMPDCALPPAPVQWVGASESASTASVAKPARKVVAIRRTPVKFFAAFVEPASCLIDLRAPDPGAPAASVPLFKGHCSFLL